MYDTTFPLEEESIFEETSQEVTKRRDDTSKQFLAFATEHIELFHTPEQVPYARYRGIVEPVDAPLMKRLTYEYHKATGRLVGKSAASTVQYQLEAEAVYAAEERPVFKRVARIGDTVYVDGHTYIAEVTARGIRTLSADDSNAPVYFIRPPGSQPLPLPNVEDGTLAPLRRILCLDNPRYEYEWTAIVVWLLCALSGREYPILAFSGEQGSGKTISAEVLIHLIDPSPYPALSGEARNALTLLAYAAGGHIVSMDNLSGLRGEMSDILCRMSTGSMSGTALTGWFHYVKTLTSRMASGPTMTNDSFSTYLESGQRYGARGIRHAAGMCTHCRLEIALRWKRTRPLSSRCPSTSSSR